MFQIRTLTGSTIALLFFLTVEAGFPALPGQVFSHAFGGSQTPWMRLVSSPAIYGLPNTAVTSPIVVRVTDQNGNVLRNSLGQVVRLPISFRITAFPSGATGQKLTPGNATSITVLTNNTGYASASLVLGNKNGVYWLAIKENFSGYTIDWARGVTPGMTASLTFVRVDTATRIANGVDASTVTVRARDYQGNPVAGAMIFLATDTARDHKEIYPTTEAAGGLYTGRLATIVAGRRVLSAWDTATNAKSRSISSPLFVSGPAVRTDIYAVDGPGGAQLRTTAIVSAFAADAFENRVGPPRANVRFTTDFGTIASTSTSNNEWTARVVSASAGIANVTARDTISGTSATRAIVFPGPAPSLGMAAPPTQPVWQNHHIKFWKPKGADVSNLIAGEISGKRIVYGVKSPMLGGPAIYITYAVNEYDFTKVDKNGDGVLEEFKNPNNPTEEEKNLIRNCVAGAENVFIVPGMSDNSYGETIPGGGVVINQGAAGANPPVQDGKTLAHENTHYWDLNAGNHTEGGRPLGPDNIGATDPSNASLVCTNRDILTSGQLQHLKNLFPKGPPVSGAVPITPSSFGPNLVYAGSVNNRINFTFTNSAAANSSFAPLSGLRASVVLSSPTLVQNIWPTSITLAPSSLASGRTATASFLFNVSPSALVGTGCLVEVAVTCNTGEAYYTLLALEIAAPPAAGENWRRYEDTGNER